MKSETLRARAAAAQAKADAANHQAFGMAERFEGGQPIIVNHHSTAGARRDRARIDSLTRTAIDAQQRADDLNRAAERAERIAELREQLDSVSFGPDDVRPGDVVRIGDLNTGSTLPFRVVRVNRKSVGTALGTFPFDRIVSVVRP